MGQACLRQPRVCPMEDRQAAIVLKRPPAARKSARVLLCRRSEGWRTSRQRASVQQEVDASTNGTTFQVKRRLAPSLPAAAPVSAATQERSLRRCGAAEQAESSSGCALPGLTLTAVVALWLALATPVPLPRSVPRAMPAVLVAISIPVSAGSDMHQEKLIAGRLPDEGAPCVSVGDTLSATGCAAAANAPLRLSSNPAQYGGIRALCSASPRAPLHAFSHGAANSRSAGDWVSAVAVVGCQWEGDDGAPAVLLPVSPIGKLVRASQRF